MITSANGKQMKALDVFGESVKFLKEHFLKNINNRNAGNRITVDKVRWVLTVPAIWNDPSKQLMREAANKVCYIHEKFINIVLQPLVTKHDLLHNDLKK